MTEHEVIYKLYPAVVRIFEGVALDASDTPVVIDMGLVQQHVQTTEYQRKRAAEYPPMSDYLDGVVKGDQAQIDKYIADCLAVKAKYPKP